MPEAGRDDEEHVWHVHAVVLGAQEFDGRDGEGIAVGQDLLAQEVKLEGRDAEEDAGDGREGLPRCADALGDFGVRVNGCDAVAHGHGGAIDGLGDVCRGCGEGNASCEGHGASWGACG